MRSHAKISILDILGIRVLFDIIREFARDSTAPTPACNFVRHVAALIKNRNLWANYDARAWTYEGFDPTRTFESEYEWYPKKFLEHRVMLKYDHETRMMRVKHVTVADEDDYRPEVKLLVLRQECIEEGVQRLDELHNTIQVRFRAWEKLVQGHVWSAACSNDWNMWPLEKIEANYERYRLFSCDVCLFWATWKIDHVVDLSTLKLLQE